RYGLTASGEIGDVALKEFRCRRDPRPAAVDQAVQHPHPVAFGEQTFDEMAADESGAAGDEEKGHGKDLTKLPAEHSRRNADGKRPVCLCCLLCGAAGL